MGKIVILLSRKTRIPEICALLVQAFVDNPTHVAIFGKDNVVSNERFFRLMLNNRKGAMLAAESDGVVVGVIGIEKHPRPVSLESKPQFTPESLLASESVITGLNELDSIREKLEQKESHYHVGPVAVLPEFQHKGIGSKMVEHCCRILDCEASSGYLETESIANVEFYNKFRFQVVLGVPNFFMRRFPLSR